MKSILILCISLCVCSFVGAQHFTEGYYVTDEKDTIRGLIEDRSDLGNFNVCNFKSSPDAPVESFTSEDILAFGFANDAAYREFIFKEKNGTLLDGFFKILVSGKLTLVNYDRRYFAVTEKQEIYELTRSETEASGKPKDNFQGLGHLKLLMSDCPTTNEQWLLKNFFDNNLKKVFITYNECVKSPMWVYEGIRIKPTFGFGAQLVPSVIAFKADYPMGQMNNNNTITGGVFVSMSNPRKWRNINVVMEGNFVHYSGHSYFKIYDYNPTANDVFVKYSALQLPVYLRAGWKYFLDLGLMSNFVIAQNGAWRIESLQTNTVRTLVGSSHDWMEQPLDF